MSILTKHASTALVRRMAQGLLSPKTIQRAAGAMPEGKFRFVKNLGRGQFSVADQVVGNFGNGAAGQAVRKMPTTHVSPVAEYGPTARLTEQLNQHFQPSILQRAVARVQGKQAAPPLAPYMAVNPRGGFQAMADGYVPWLPKKLKKTIGDLHEGNIGRGGQVFDYSLEHVSPSMGTLDPTMSPVPLTQMFRRPRLDGVPLGAGQDLLGNTAHQPAGVRDALAPMVAQSNNYIRRYWSLPPDQRAAFLTDLRQRTQGRGNEALRRFMHARDNAATTPQSQPQRVGMWTDFKYDPKPYLTVGGLGAGATGGLGYGAYQAYQSLFGE